MRTKDQCHLRCRMSAFGGKADMAFCTAYVVLLTQSGLMHYSKERTPLDHLRRRGQSASTAHGGRAPWQPWAIGERGDERGGCRNALPPSCPATPHQRITNRW